MQTKLGLFAVAIVLAIVGAAVAEHQAKYVPAAAVLLRQQSIAARNAKFAQAKLAKPQWRRHIQAQEKRVTPEPRFRQFFQDLWNGWNGNKRTTTVRPLPTQQQWEETTPQPEWNEESNLGQNSPGDQSESWSGTGDNGQYETTPGHWDNQNTDNWHDGTNDDHHYETTPLDHWDNQNTDNWHDGTNDGHHYETTPLDHWDNQNTDNWHDGTNDDQHYETTPLDHWDNQNTDNWHDGTNDGHHYETTPLDHWDNQNTDNWYDGTNDDHHYETTPGHWYDDHHYETTPGYYYDDHHYETTPGHWYDDHHYETTPGHWYDDHHYETTPGHWYDDHHYETTPGHWDYGTEDYEYESASPDYSNHGTESPYTGDHHQQPPISYENEGCSFTITINPGGCGGQPIVQQDVGCASFLPVAAMAAG